jgi:hypothetical protein
MSELSVKKSTQFHINELTLVTKAGPIDIQKIFEELNIYDSMFLPVISGNILIRDAIGLSGKLLFDGSESILIDIAKDENSDIGKYRKAFRIYKQSDRKNENQNSETFILHFVSDELMFSDQQRINQNYDLTYSQVVEKILFNYLKVPQNNIGGIYEPTSGIRSIVIPNLRPLDAIEWCTKRALDKQNSPNYVFFQNLVGYNFVSLSTLLTQDDVLDIKFEPKNQSGKNSLQEISSARYLEVIAQNDTIEKTRAGVNAGKFMGFDPMTRTFEKKNISYGDHFLSMKHGNDNPNITTMQNRDGQKNVEAFDSKKVVSLFGTARQLSNYIKQADPASLSKVEAQENFIFQRKAILTNLMGKRVKLVMPGNFQLTSGFNVNLTAPTFGQKEKGDTNEDKSLSGKYVIVASRHIIGFDKHETIIEVASSSNSNEFIPADNPQQTRAMLEF